MPSERSNNNIFQLALNNQVDSLIEILSKHPEKVNLQDEMGRTPFWIAAYFGHTDLVQKMIQPPIINHLDFSTLDNYHMDALDAAKSMNRRGVIELLEPLFGVGVYKTHPGEDHTPS